MSQSERAHDTLAHEQSPLLGDGKTLDNGTIERGTGQDGSRVNEADEPIADEPTTKQLLIVQSGIWLGAFLAAADSTIVATLSAPISTSFNSLSLLSWLASSYFIATAALQPLSGKLTDIFSRRTGLIASNVFFAAGNLICGLAKEEWVMILGRVVAGMGGGGLMAISTFVASDLVPLRRRGVWQGFGNICFGVGASVGGVFGGWINDTIGWRYAFLIQVPLAALSGIAVYLTVNIPVRITEQSRWKRIDYLGATVLIFTLVSLLLGLNSGGNLVPWTHPLVLANLPLSAILLGLFVYIENSYAMEPIIPIKLLLNRTILSACLTNWFVTMAVYGILFYGPIYFQVKGLSSTQAGVRLIPQSVGVGVGSVSVGLVMRWAGRYYALNVASEALFVLSIGLVSTWTLTTASWQHFLYLFLMGIGYAGMLTITLLALISATDHRYQAVTTSTSYLFRSTGATLGITIASAVFQNILKLQLWSRFGDREDAAIIISRIRESLDEIEGLPKGWKEGVMDAYMNALRGVFLTMFGLATLGALISLLMREHKLHKTLARRPSQS